MYLLDLGQIEQTIAKQAVREGKDLPERIANAPELLPELQIYLQAFFDLDSERSHGLGLSPIPITSILNYAKFSDFDKEQTSDLVYLIRAMDSEHLKRLDKKQKK